jgi:hypothetical protein
LSPEFKRFRRRTDSLDITSSASLISMTVRI